MSWSGDEEFLSIFHGHISLAELSENCGEVASLDFGAV